MNTEFSARMRICSALAAATLTLLLSACASPDVVPHEVPPPPVASVAEADQQLASVARERAVIEARFSERERVCYTKFLVNKCLDEAKEQHRSGLVAQRAIEVQANRFKRKALVEERDRNLAEADRKFQEQEAHLAEQPPKPAAVVLPPAPPRKSTLQQRTAERNARVQAAQQKEAADAGKRAKNVEDYAARKAESDERVRKVAQRKADKAAKAAKDADAAKVKAAEAAAKAPAATPAH
jgi:colicin import membrane protein